MTFNCPSEIGKAAQHSFEDLMQFDDLMQQLNRQKKAF